MNETPSPYYSTSAKEILLDKIQDLRIPNPQDKVHSPCSPGCHLVERNHTIEQVIKIIEDLPNTLE